MRGLRTEQDGGGTWRVTTSDVLVPTAIAALGVVELLLAPVEGKAWGVVLELLAAVILVWRRVAPFVAGPAAAAVLLVMPWAGPQLDDVATPIAFLALIGYTAGRWVATRRGLAIVLVVLGLVVVDLTTVDVRTTDVTDIVFVASLLVPPYIFGRVALRLAVQSEELRRMHEQVRDQAVREERERIARDLHDVIAHSVSAMVVQTAAAQDLVRTDPDRAEAVLADVADTGRRALSETGRLLHVLRDDADELGLRPAPGLAELPDLVQRFRDQGLAVEAELPHDAPDLPPGVDVSTYRIAAELLTNALRYAADRTVRLQVAVDGGALVIRVGNRSSGRTGAGSGLGLAGVAERVGVLGGTLRHGAAGDRFEVEARLPVTP